MAQKTKKDWLPFQDDKFPCATYWIMTIFQLLWFNLMFIIYFLFSWVLCLYISDTPLYAWGLPRTTIYPAHPIWPKDFLLVFFFSALLNWIECFLNSKSCHLLVCTFLFCKGVCLIVYFLFLNDVRKANSLETLHVWKHFCLYLYLITSLPERGIICSKSFFQDTSSQDSIVALGIDMSPLNVPSSMGD